MENHLAFLEEATPSTSALVLKEAIELWITRANEVMNNIFLQEKISSITLKKLSYLLLRILKPVYADNGRTKNTKNTKNNNSNYTKKAQERALEMLLELSTKIPSYPLLLMILELDSNIEWDFPSTIQHHIKEETSPSVIIIFLKQLLKNKNRICHNWLLHSEIGHQSQTCLLNILGSILKNTPTFDEISYLDELWSTGGVIISYDINNSNNNNNNTNTNEYIIPYPLEYKLINHLLESLFKPSKDSKITIALLSCLSRQIIYRQPAITSSIHLNQLALFISLIINDGDPRSTEEVRDCCKRIAMEFDLLIRPRYQHLLPPSLSLSEIKHIVSDFSGELDVVDGEDSMMVIKDIFDDSSDNCHLTTNTSSTEKNMYTSDTINNDENNGKAETPMISSDVITIEEDEKEECTRLQLPSNPAQLKDMEEEEEAKEPKAKLSRSMIDNIIGASSGDDGQELPELHLL